MLAVALTSFLLLVVSPEAEATGAEATGAEATGAAGVLAVAQNDGEARPDAATDAATDAAEEAEGEAEGEAAPVPTPRAAARDPASVVQAAEAEARVTLPALWETFLGSLPRFILAFGLLLSGWLITRVARFLFRLVSGGWQRADGLAAIFGIAVWLLVVGVAISVLVGDVRALVGSLGLVGLALSWALQAPIESFTGWLLNSLRSYYRVGDRIEVGEVFGDVYRIDLLTTTVWEMGSPHRPSFVRAEQPTGRLITFPNSEVLTGSIVNYTRDFPWLWDEVATPVANESDLRFAVDRVAAVAAAYFGEEMAVAAREYSRSLREAGIDYEAAPHPEVFVSLQDSWTDITVRYLVPARARRGHKSELVLRLHEELMKPENARRIIPALPRQQLQLLDEEGRPRDFTAA